jgi:hypothetical protein
MLADALAKPTWEECPKYQDRHRTRIAAASSRLFVPHTLASSVLKVGESSGLVPPMSSCPCIDAILASSCRFSS